PRTGCSASTSGSRVRRSRGRADSFASAKRCGRNNKWEPPKISLWVSSCESPARGAPLLQVGKCRGFGPCRQGRRRAAAEAPAGRIRQRGARQMLVRQILGVKGREVIAISCDASLSEAAQLLARKRIGALVVRDEVGNLAGVLSERDVVRALADMSVSALARPVSAYMTRAVATCCEQDTVDDLMEMMTHGRFRHVPVVENDRVTGIVSIGDVVKTRIAETEQEAASLRDY